MYADYVQRPIRFLLSLDSLFPATLCAAIPMDATAHPDLFDIFTPIRTVSRNLSVTTIDTARYRRTGASVFYNYLYLWPTGLLDFPSLFARIKCANVRYKYIYIYVSYPIHISYPFLPPSLLFFFRLVLLSSLACYAFSLWIVKKVSCKKCAVVLFFFIQENKIFSKNLTLLIRRRTKRPFCPVLVFLEWIILVICYWCIRISIIKLMKYI